MSLLTLYFLHVTLRIDDEFCIFKQDNAQAHRACERINFLGSNFAKCSQILKIVSPANLTVIGSKTTSTYGYSTL